MTMMIKEIEDIKYSSFPSFIYNIHVIIKPVNDAMIKKVSDMSYCLIKISFFELLVSLIPDRDDEDAAWIKSSTVILVAISFFNFKKKNFSMTVIKECRHIQVKIEIPLLFL